MSGLKASEIVNISFSSVTQSLSLFLRPAQTCRRSSTLSPVLQVGAFPYLFWMNEWVQVNSASLHQFPNPATGKPLNFPSGC